MQRALRSLLSSSLSLLALASSLSGCVKKAGGEPNSLPDTIADRPAQFAFGSRPQSYVEGSLLPSASPEERDAAVLAFYDYWKKKYLKPGCNPGELVIESKTKPTNLTVSEAHGYGMIVFAYMAGKDPDAKKTFDAMVRYHRVHQSRIRRGFMAWYQNDSCADVGGDNGATDGDLDIAYAYLLADKQWGSCGEVDYRAHAEWVIAAMQAKGIDGQGRYPLLGDWVNRTYTPKQYHGSRVSDFMGSHFRAFQSVANDGVWSGLLSNTYWIADTLQRNYAPTTGLLPDFAQDLRTDDPKPATPGFLEGKRDGTYAYNACRIPLRMGTDYLLNGDPRPKTIATRLNRFALQTSGGDPKALRGGYYLDGKPMVDYETMAFTAPFAVGAMVDTNQAWLDALWTHVATREPERYYEDTLRMLSMIVLSGNWWAPEKAKSPCPELPTAP